MDRLSILHVLRAPVGGLFRHVRDLAGEQARRGHAVGVVCDAAGGDALTAARLNELAASLALGLHRIAMARQLSLRDIAACRTVRRIAEAKGVGILHGHGAKGGAFARLAAAGLRRQGLPVQAFYTPHGGSLHYHPMSLIGRLYLGLERRLEPATGGIIFESAFAARTYAAKVGMPSCPVRVIGNGLSPADFTPIEPAADAADFLFVGELRHLKGVDVLLTALASVGQRRPLRAVIVGSGPDAARFRTQAERLGLGGRVIFSGAMPAAAAFGLGRCLVAPSRAESLPYVVLEAAAAGLPVIATSVGGIPEITAGSDTELVPADDAAALAADLERFLTSPESYAARALRLRELVGGRFTIAAMTDGVLAFYLGRPATERISELLTAAPLRAA